MRLANSPMNSPHLGARFLIFYVDGGSVAFHVLIFMLMGAPSLFTFLILCTWLATWGLRIPDGGHVSNSFQMGATCTVLQIRAVLRRVFRRVLRGGRTPKKVSPSGPSRRRASRTPPPPHRTPTLTLRRYSVLVSLDGCEVRRCDPCALVRPRVPCVSRVCPGSPVSFYRYSKATTRICGIARESVVTHEEDRGTARRFQRRLKRQHKRQHPGCCPQRCETWHLNVIEASTIHSQWHIPG